MIVGYVPAELMYLHQAYVFEEIQCIQPKLFKTILWSVCAQWDGNILVKVKPRIVSQFFTAGWGAVMYTTNMCKCTWWSVVFETTKAKCGARPEKLEQCSESNSGRCVSLSVKTQMATRSESIVQCTCTQNGSDHCIAGRCWRRLHQLAPICQNWWWESQEDSP